MSCIYIFRRDLRLTDNTTLISVATRDDVTEILPVFIYDHSQITGPYCSQKFLYIQEEALADLDSYLAHYGSRLHRFYGTPHKVVSYLIREYAPKYVAFNMDYSIYSGERDRAIEEVCKNANIQIIARHDVVMTHIAFNKMYWEYARRLADETIIVRKNNTRKYVSRNFKHQCDNLDMRLNIGERERYLKHKPVTATRKWALDRIRGPTDAKQTKQYLISTHLKLGLISSREVFKYASTHGISHLVRQMTWRDFYFACWRAHRDNYNFYDQRYLYMDWRNDATEMKAMWTGRTGYAFIDAAMNELNTTGLMWNRARLMVGFFSVKILRINPFYDGTKRELTIVGSNELIETEKNNHKKKKQSQKSNWDCGGQIYFSRHLIDACYANNTGNWHWVASDTVDSSGQRFGRNWAGRPMNVESWTSEDEIYISQWLPNYKDYKIPRIVDAQLRWKEWLALTT